MTIAETANLHQADDAVKPGVEAQESFGLACVQPQLDDLGALFAD
jgi:hypothetical protein